MTAVILLRMAHSPVPRRPPPSTGLGEEWFHASPFSSRGSTTSTLGKEVVQVPSFLSDPTGCESVSERHVVDVRLYVSDFLVHVLDVALEWFVVSE